MHYKEWVFFWQCPLSSKYPQWILYMWLLCLVMRWTILLDIVWFSKQCFESPIRCSCVISSLYLLYIILNKTFYKKTRWRNCPNTLYVTFLTYSIPYLAIHIFSSNISLNLCYTAHLTLPLLTETYLHPYRFRCFMKMAKRQETRIC